MRLLLIASLIAAAPAVAQAPAFTTAAPFAYMKDLSTGQVLFAQGENEPIPPASMGKMMTVYVAFDLLKRGDAKLGQKLRVRPETWRQWHSQGSTMFLSVDEQVSVENLLHGIVTLSGNDACVVLGEGLAGTEEAFVQLMNQHAKRMGLTGSTFANTSGWPDPNERVTPRDLAIIAERTILDHPDLYRRFYGKKDFTWGKTLGAGKAITQPNRNPLLGKVSGADGLKTGHTEEAGYGFTGSAVQDGRRIVMVVAGLSSFNERIAESVRFMEWGFRAWTAKTIAPAGKVLGRAPVWMGAESEVSLVAPRDLKIVTPRGVGDGRKVTLAYDGPLKAPIAKGAKVAELVVTTPGLPTARLPVVAGEAVGEAGMMRRLALKLRALVTGG